MSRHKSLSIFTMEIFTFDQHLPISSSFPLLVSTLPLPIDFNSMCGIVQYHLSDLACFTQCSILRSIHGATILRFPSILGWTIFYTDHCLYLFAKYFEWWCDMHRSHMSLSWTDFISFGDILAVRLQSHLVFLFVIFWGSPILFSIAAIPISIPPNSVFSPHLLQHLSFILLK